MVSNSLLKYLKKIENDEMILIWKRNFNSMVDKANKANAYMEESSVTLKEKDSQYLKYFLEVLEPFERYIEIFMALGIQIPLNSFEGFPEARNIKD